MRPFSSPFSFCELSLQSTKISRPSRITTISVCLNPILGTQDLEMKYILITKMHTYYII